MPAGQLGIVFALTSNAAGLSRGFRQANQEMSGFQAKARAFGKAAAIPLAAVGVAGARAAVQLVGEFDQAQKTIAQQTGATGAELQALTDDMRAAFGQVPQSMTEVAEALGTINTRFGSTGQTLQDQTRLFLDFSRVTGTQVSTAVSTLAAQLTNFDEPASSLNETLGDMVRIQQETGLAGADMARQFNEYGPLFANLNLTVEQTAAVFGQLAQSNIAVSRIAPGLNAFIRNTAALGKDPLTALRNVVDEIRDAAVFTDALNTATEAFGAEGAQRMTTAIRAGNFDLQDFNGLLGRGAGLVQEQGEEMLTLGERFTRVGNQIKSAAAPALSSFADATADVLDTFRTQGFAAAVSEAFDAVGEAGSRAFDRFTDWASENRLLAGAMTVAAGAAFLLFTRTHPLVAAFTALSAAWAALQGDNVALQLLSIAAAATAVGVAVYRGVAAFQALRGAAAGAAVAQAASGAAGAAGGVAGGLGGLGGFLRGGAARAGLVGAGVTAALGGVYLLTRDAAERRSQESEAEELERLRGYTGRRGVSVRSRIRELERRRSFRLGDEFTGAESARLDRGITSDSSFNDLVAASQRVAQGTATGTDLTMLQNADPIQGQLAQQAATAQMQSAQAQEQAAAAQRQASQAMLDSIPIGATAEDALLAALQSGASLEEATDIARRADARDKEHYTTVEHAAVTQIESMRATREGMIAEVNESKLSAEQKADEIARINQMFTVGLYETNRRAIFEQQRGTAEVVTATEGVTAAVENQEMTPNIHVPPAEVTVSPTTIRNFVTNLDAEFLLGGGLDPNTRGTISTAERDRIIADVRRQLTSWLQRQYSRGTEQETSSGRLVNPPARINDPSNR